MSEEVRRRAVEPFLARRPDLPVGLVTGWGDAPQASDEQLAHVDFVIAKPVTLAVLRDAIAELTG